MKAYKLKIKGSFKEITEFIRYCMKNKVDLWFSWQTEDVFDPPYFAIVTVRPENVQDFETRFKNQIKESENI